MMALLLFRLTRWALDCAEALAAWLCPEGKIAGVTLGAARLCGAQETCDDAVVEQSGDLGCGGCGQVEAFADGGVCGG